MTHKQMKFKRIQDCNRTRTFRVSDEPHCEERSRRALLLSSQDADRMAVESSRARLMIQLVNKPEEKHREFGSYFRKLKNESNPVYVMTSHTSAIPIPKRIVPAFPSLVQDLRWSPSLETYSEDSQTDNGEDDINYTCRCHKCKMKQCPGRGSKTENIRRCLRNNIMKFSDNSTMTPKLTDIGCGENTSLNPTPITAEVSMATSQILGKDHSLHQIYQIIPLPILKKSEHRNNVHQNKEDIKKSRVSVTVHEAVRDASKCNSSDKLFKPLQRQDPEVPPCPNNSDNSSDCEHVRKVLYNEGISDVIKKNTHARYPVKTLPSMRIHSPKRNFSKVSIMTKCFYKEAIIPYAHRVRSKYHSDCKPSFTKAYRCEIEEDNIHKTESPVVFRRTEASKAIRCTRTPSIRLPKKVLTSERDIEAFVDKTKSKKKFPLSP